MSGFCLTSDPAALGITTPSSVQQFQPVDAEDVTPSSAGRAALCLVPGCTEDLSTQCTYNKRYKICGTHRAMLNIDINGKVMRFCQQCARLQDVDKFNGDRRSCHERLEIHNKRRAQGKNSSPAVVLGHVTKLKCQVPECTENLLDHKAYNQRYKICPYHRAREELIINGQSLRFCQQCAKLQSVSDFEGAKRSCKDKLMKHNSRRLLLKRTLEEREDATGQRNPPGSYCQVPGCQQDLREMKVYNIRYKVCANHLTMSEVNINGQKVRFCQQCARFQPINEFDSLKRSCRARLDKHNQRRRAAAQQKAMKTTAEGEAPTVSDSAAPAAGAAAGAAPALASDPKQMLSAIQTLIVQQQQSGTASLPALDPQALQDMWAQAQSAGSAGGAPVMLPNMPMMSADGSASPASWMGTGLVPPATAQSGASAEPKTETTT